MIIDIIIIVILLIGLYIGYNKGIVNQIFDIVSLVLGYFVSILLSSRLAILLAQIIPFSNNSILKEVSSVTSYINNNFSLGYYKVISFFIIFFGFRILLRFVGNMLGIVKKLPVIKDINKILGAIMGLIEAYIIVFIIVYIMFLIPLGENISKSLLESTLPKLIIENTPLLSSYIIEKFFSIITITL